jgi:hypothetical protein
MERRAIPRKPVLMSGVIKFAGSTINCLICNMTISGAALDVTNPREKPAVALVEPGVEVSGLFEEHERIEAGEINQDG